MASRRKGDPLGTGTRRMTAEARRRQVVQAALKAIGRYGVPGTTISRIAKGAGITTAALYTHFDNRRAILLAALDQVYERIFEGQRSTSSTDAVQQLRDIAEHHARLIASQGVNGHARLFLDFISAAPERGLRDAMLQKEAIVAANLEAIVEQGKRQGTIAEDADPEQVAMLIGAWAWAGDVALLLGRGSKWSDKASPALLELILQSISTEAPPPEREDAPVIADARREGECSRDRST